MQHTNRYNSKLHKVLDDVVEDVLEVKDDAIYDHKEILHVRYTVNNAPIDVPRNVDLVHDAVVNANTTKDDVEYQVQRLDHRDDHVQEVCNQQETIDALHALIDDTCKMNVLAGEKPQAQNIGIDTQSHIELCN